MAFASDKEALDALRGKHAELTAEIRKVIVGQEEVVEQVLVSVFSGGHCLLVGVPGLAKTLLVNTIAQALGLSFNRIQFTPDLMPSDIIGSEILDDQRRFQFNKGPSVRQHHPRRRDQPDAAQNAVRLARGHAGALASLPLDSATKLPHPFFVLATQNPIEQEGTYPLPEAQLDRFMFNIWVDYPEYADELEVVKRTTGGESASVNPVLSGDEIAAFQQHIRKMPVADNVVEYAVKLAAKTRPGREHAPDQVNQYLSWGAGPRASQYLIVAAKCHAAFAGKYSPDIENVRAVALPILRHRIVRNYKAEAEGVTVESLIGKLA